MVTLKVSINVTARRMTIGRCRELDLQFGPIELLTDDGLLYAFASNMAEAKRLARGLIDSEFDVSVEEVDDAG